VPDLVGNEAAEKSTHLFAPRIFSVEESTGSEIVGFAFHLELLVGDERFLWVVL